MKQELADLLEGAHVAYGEMTPEQRRKMFRAQRRSWVIGNLMLDYPEMSREYAEAIFDRASSRV